MADSLITRVRSAFNAFVGRGASESINTTYVGAGSSIRPDRPRLNYGNSESIIAPLLNKIAVDVASMSIQHARTDEEGRFLEPIKSGLNNCLTLEANIDQSSFAFKFDVALSLLDEGVIAIVPIDTDVPREPGRKFDVLSMRVGKIVQWYPQHVRVNVYNDRTGLREDILIRKEHVAIPENPLFSVLNEQNSIARRLIRALNLLDAIDQQSSAGKLDLIIQLPYTVRSEARRAQAEIRRKDIEAQLTGSKYGIAYADGTEKITQLNRPVENNLMKKIEYLTSMLHGQLGMSEEILKGTANAEQQNAYFARSVEPVITAIVEEFRRKYLTQTARSQLQSVMYFRDPFKFVPVSELANIADKFTRNEILTPNEVRQIIGFKPSKDPAADELKNRNIRGADSDSGLTPGMPAEGQNGSETPPPTQPGELPPKGQIKPSDVEALFQAVYSNT